MNLVRAGTTLIVQCWLGYCRRQLCLLNGAMENSRWCCWCTVAETAVPSVVQVDRSSQCYAGELFVVRCADIAVDDGS